jgi:hypothetical protein
MEVHVAILVLAKMNKWVYHIFIFQSVILQKQIILAIWTTKFIVKNMTKILAQIFCFFIPIINSCCTMLDCK